ncbi:MAG: organoarsenical effux MFS transporter ArsJ [Lentisphaeraceae bacterium]|nr:organoarsenical effux MFS transporter ArsJ [Lentisphaeraceae bacterium]
MTAAVRNYAIVTGAYWSFMLTDGALRMLVLLYFHDLGYTPVQLAFLFLLYEFFGIVTNLVGGWLASQFGLKMTLVWGLSLQAAALFGLSYMNPEWDKSFAVPFVMGIQALSGIAKDLTKMSSKTAIKFLVPEDQGTRLFKWVAILTGSKNAVKGAGFFVGGALLQSIGFKNSLLSMGVLLVVIFLFSMFLLPKEIGTTKSKNKLKSIFTQGRKINILSSARVFLFGARDIWFVVAVPVFMTTALNWNFSQVGGFMAVWVIIYGAVQAYAPQLIKLRTGGEKPDGKAALELAIILTVVMAALTILLNSGWNPQLSIIIGLYLFGAVFAINSSVHSFLIIDYADGDKAAINVGFYYMANALGRLVGTLLSGLLFQWGGVISCLTGSVIFLIITSLISGCLPKNELNTEKSVQV